MGFAKADTLDLLELKTCKDWKNWQVKNTTKWGIFRKWQVDEDHNSPQKNEAKYVCIIWQRKIRCFQVRKHASGMCWFGTKSEVSKQLWSHFCSMRENGLWASSVPLLCRLFSLVIYMITKHFWPISVMICFPRASLFDKNKVCEVLGLEMKIVPRENWREKKGENILTKLSWIYLGTNLPCV